MLKTKKAFTLIELLIVIAIIGILAGVILVSTSSGKNRAKDAAIIAAAKSVMQAIQVESLSSGDYSQYIHPGWFTSVSDCDFFLAQPNAASLKTACISIMNNNGPNTGYGGWSAAFLVTRAIPGVTPKLSVMATLPGAKKIYCAGSNGGTSDAVNVSDGSGCGGQFFLCSGCLYDPNGGGN